MSRLAEGYEPNFDIDAEFGHQGELYVANIITALKEGAVEVKVDSVASRTGNLYVEYKCQRRGVWCDSGIKTTAAETYVFVLGGSQVAVVVPTAALLALCPDARTVQQTRGSHPTIGKAVRIADVLYGRRA